MIYGCLLRLTNGSYHLPIILEVTLFHWIISSGFNFLRPFKIFLILIRCYAWSFLYDLWYLFFIYGTILQIFWSHDFWPLISASDICTLASNLWSLPLTSALWPLTNDLCLWHLCSGLWPLISASDICALASDLWHLHSSLWPLTSDICTLASDLWSLPLTSALWPLTSDLCLWHLCSGLWPLISASDLWPLIS